MRIPGSEDGNEFAARMAEAIAQMEAAGDANEDGEVNVVAFSHGATMMFWTMMTVDNPDLLLMLQHPLENTDVVVVDKNDDGSYTLKSWAARTWPRRRTRCRCWSTFVIWSWPRRPRCTTCVSRCSTPTSRPSARPRCRVRDVGDATVKFVSDSVTDTVDAIRDLVRPRAIRSEEAEKTAPAETADLEATAVEVPAVEVTAEAEPESDRALIRQLKDARAERAARAEAAGTTVRDVARSTCPS